MFLLMWITGRSAMPDALVCPKCSAPVPYPDGGRFVTCPSCQATFPLDRLASMSGRSDIPKQYRPLVEKALQIAQAAGYTGQLNKIEAIKFYRQASGASLADAKRVIESVGPLHAGPSPGGQAGQGGPQSPWAGQGGPPAGGAGGLVKLLVMLVIGVALAAGIWAIVHKP